jgi:hypothetical protein
MKKAEERALKGYESCEQGVEMGKNTLGINILPSI